MKVLHAHLASDACAGARFYAEARAVNLIGHENIVNIFDMNVVPPSRYYLIMEYLEGEPLTAAPPGPMAAGAGPADPHPGLRRARRPRTPAAWSTATSSRRTSSSAARAGDHFVKILDFGIAKLFGGETQEEQTARRRRSSARRSTWRPSRARARRWTAAPTSTRWGSSPTASPPGGCRSPPAASPASSSPTGTRSPTPPRELNPRVSQAWNDAILGALAKRREDRFPDADAFRAALERALTRTAASQGPVTAASGSPTEVARRARPHPARHPRARAGERDGADPGDVPWRR